YADEFEIIDIVDEKACLQYAQTQEIDGVITAATDYGVLSTAYIAKEMNLPGLEYEVAKLIKNKFLVRRALFQKKVDDINQFFEIDNLEMLQNIRDKVNFPVIVKPCDGSGSKGIKRVDTYEDLNSACEVAIKSSLVGKALVEDFIKGKEFGIET